MTDIALPAQKESIWQNKNFVILLTSGLLIGFGGRVYELALPLIIYELSQSSVAMGTMRAIEFLPNMLFAMVIGVFVDRVDKKKWMITMVSLQMLVLFTLYFLTDQGFEQLELFYVAGFCLMLLQYAYGNAKTSSVKWALPKPMLTSANAKFTFVRTFMEIMGPAISGAILFLSSLYHGLLITASVYSVALLVLSFLKLDEETPVKRKGNFIEELKEGWFELRQNRPMWNLTWFVVFFNASGGVYEVMLIFFVKDELQWSTALVGGVLSCAGVGGIIGSMLAERVRNHLGIGKTIAVATIALSPTYAMIAIYQNIFMVGLSLFLFGLLTTIQSICIWSYRHETTPAPLIGRVSGITGSIFKLGMPLAIFGSGYITESAGATTVFLACGISQILIFAAFYFSPMMQES